MVNILNSHTIRFYSFEPPTALISMRFLFFGDEMRVMILIVLMLFMPCVSRAAIASKEYVEQKIESKVDTTETANQTMAGTYTVSGSLTVTGAFKVPTPPLPNPEAD